MFIYNYFVISLLTPEEIMASHRATPTAASTEDLRPRPRHWFLLFVVLLAAFIAVFDLFVVNIAVPVLRIELRASETMLALTVSGYAFAYGAGLVTGARLGDRFGYRRVFVLGLAAFTLASLLCGLACLLYTSPSPRDVEESRMPSSA